MAPTCLLSDALWVSWMTDVENRRSANTVPMQFTTNLPEITELLSLYASVGWNTYADEPEALERAVRQSHFVLSARSEAGELLGFVRTVSDDVSIMLVQTLAVRPEAQRLGIGRALMERVTTRYAHVTQHVLITKNQPHQLEFYASLGWHNTRDLVQDVTNCFYRNTRRELS